MKRFFPRLLFVTMLLAVTAGSTLRAQDTIGFSAWGFSGMPTQVWAPDTVTVGAFVKNTGSFNLAGDTVQINGWIDTGAAYVPISFPPVWPVTIPAGDSTFFLIPIEFKDNYQGGPFRIGGNTIIIWPATLSPGSISSDTLRATVFLIDTINSVPDNRYEDYPDVRCYPVPGSGPLFIMSADPMLRPSEVIVRDVNGRIVLVSKNPANGIAMEEWMKGIYFIEIVFENGKKGVYKIMR